MAFRRIKHEDKVAAVNECLEINNLNEVAKKYSISPQTLSSYCTCVLEETGEILQKKSLVGRLKIKLKMFFKGAK